MNNWWAARAIEFYFMFMFIWRQIKKKKNRKISAQYSMPDTVAKVLKARQTESEWRARDATIFASAHIKHVNLTSFLMAFTQHFYGEDLHNNKEQSSTIDNINEQYWTESRLEYSMYVNYRPKFVFISTVNYPMRRDKLLFWNIFLSHSCIEFT